MKAYSNDLRQRVIKTFHSGVMTRSQLLSVFSISNSTLKRWLARYRDEGITDSKGQGGNKPFLVGPIGCHILLCLVKRHPDFTLEEYASYFYSITKYKVHSFTLRNTLIRLGVTRKKKRYFATSVQHQEFKT